MNLRDQFARAKYLSLESFKRDGTGVRTPLWFAEGDDGDYYAYTVDGSPKVRRIRNNPRVRIAPCTMRGEITGEWADAEAHIVEGEAAARGMALLNQRYWPWKSIGDLFSRLKGSRHAVIAIRFSIR